MDNYSEIKKLLEGFGIKPNYLIPATVMSIDGNTCTVKLPSEIVLTDVRLTATNEPSDFCFLVEPKINSEVLVLSQTGSLDSLVVIKVNQVSRFIYKQNGLEITVDSNDGKVLLKNASANLHTVFNNLADLLSAFSVNTPQGPSTGVMPTTATQINGFKTTINQLLKPD